MIKQLRGGQFARPIGSRAYIGGVLERFRRGQRELTLYEVLEVKTSVNQDQVKRAYYKVAKQWHPDLHQGDEEVADRFKKIQKAYEVLGNPVSREAYDI